METNIAETSALTHQGVASHPDETHEIKPRADQVSAYLRDNPEFFEHHRDLLTDIKLPHPQGQGVISLVERQQLQLRDRVRVLESQLSGLVINAKDNNNINDRIHLLTLCLLATQRFDVLAEVLLESMRRDFSVTQAALGIWAQPQHAALAEHQAFISADAPVAQWAQTLNQPYCGTQPGFDWKAVFSQNEDLRSFAVIPLRREQIFGALVLASDNENRFHTGMGTLFLERIGELVSAALMHHVALAA